MAAALYYFAINGDLLAGFHHDNIANVNLLNRDFFILIRFARTPYRCRRPKRLKSAKQPIRHGARSTWSVTWPIGKRARKLCESNLRSASRSASPAASTWT